MIALDIIAKNKIVAIVRLDDLSAAGNISDALIAGGIRAIEFTLTNEAALPTIAEIVKLVDDSVAIGAGSVINAKQVRAVAEAGAQFVVSPVCKREVIEACLALDLPTMPGAFTPSEIQQAWEWGADVVKVFPANHLGRRYIKDVHGAIAPSAADADRRRQRGQPAGIPRLRRLRPGRRLGANQQCRHRGPIKIGGVWRLKPDATSHQLP